MYYVIAECDFIGLFEQFEAKTSAAEITTGMHVYIYISPSLAEDNFASYLLRLEGQISRLRYIDP